MGLGKVFAWIIVFGGIYLILNSSFQWFPLISSEAWGNFGDSLFGFIAIICGFWLLTMNKRNPQ